MDSMTLVYVATRFVSITLMCGLCGCSSYNRDGLDPSGWYAVDTVFISTDYDDDGPQRSIRHRGDAHLVTLDPRWYSPTCITEAGKPDYAQPFYQTALFCDDEDERKAARNNLQDAMFGVSDDIFDDHMASVFATQDIVNLGMGWTAIGFATAGATGASAELMSALAVGVLGAKAQFNEQVYAEKLAEIISTAIREDRRRFKALAQLRHDDTLVQYTVEYAIADAKEYHRRGSFFHGLELVLESAQDKAAQNKETAETLNAIASLSDEGERELAFKKIFTDPNQQGISGDQRTLFLRWLAAPDAKSKGDLLTQLMISFGIMIQPSELVAGAEDEAGNATEDEETEVAPVID